MEASKLKGQLAMATPTTEEDTYQQVLKATDNVEVTHTLHQGKDASFEQGIEASQAKEATANPTTHEDTHQYVSILGKRVQVPERTQKTPKITWYASKCSLTTWTSTSKRLSLKVVRRTPILVQSLSHRTQSLIRSTSVCSTTTCSGCTFRSKSPCHIIFFF